MPEEVKSARRATEIAASFLKQYYVFLRPISAERRDTTWVVKVDVGLVVAQIVEVKIDATTAEIIGYSFPK